MASRCMKDLSKVYTAVDGGPSLEHIRIGALLRIADALEQMTPRAIERRESDARRADLWDRVCGAMRARFGKFPSPRGLGKWSLESAMVEVCGEDADADSPECWQRVLREAKGTVRMWGNRKQALARSWLAQQWPDVFTPETEES